MNRAAGAALVLGLLACDGRGPMEPPSGPPPEAPPAPPPVPPEMVYAPTAAADRDHAPRRVVAAFASDRTYASDERIEARRLVYRVRLRVPRSLGDGNAAVARPAAELHVDVSTDRLRARFRGAGWPVPEGSEIRIRRDELGAYVFDGDGGRPLGPGQMAHWFEGGRPRGTPSHRVAMPAPDEQHGPGDLICRLVAEWTGEGPTSLARRCGEGGSPPSFRLGLWLAERTADVGIRLPKHTLRADHASPPEGIRDRDHRLFLTESSMSQLERHRGQRGAPGEDAPETGLVVINRATHRMIVTLDGTPVGWLDAGTEAHFDGMEAGVYGLGALRPFGLLAAGKRAFVVPGRALLPRWIHPAERDDSP